MSRKVKRLSYYKIGNKIYYDVYFLPNKDLKNEIKYAKWLSKYFDSDVFLVPQVKTNGVRTPDYWVERYKQYWDLKIINGNSKNMIDNILKQSKNQTNRLLLKQGPTILSIKELYTQIEKCIKSNTRRHIYEVILINKKCNKIYHFKRK